MIAVRSGKTAAERSRKVSGVSGWKFAGFLSRSRSYGVIVRFWDGLNVFLRAYAQPANMDIIQITCGAEVGRSDGAVYGTVAQAPSRYLEVRIIVDLAADYSRAERYRRDCVPGRG